VRLNRFWVAVCIVTPRGLTAPGHTAALLYGAITTRLAVLEWPRPRPFLFLGTRGRRAIRRALAETGPVCRTGVTSQGAFVFAREVAVRASAHLRTSAYELGMCRVQASRRLRQSNAPAAKSPTIARARVAGSGTGVIRNAVGSNAPAAKGLKL
jgi:hypothetical protein